jgi:hypothetical protein
MGKNMKDNSSMTREKVEAYSNGKMEEFMMESGRMANNME